MMKHKLCPSCRYVIKVGRDDEVSRDGIDDVSRDGIDIKKSGCPRCGWGKNWRGSRGGRKGSTRKGRKLREYVFSLQSGICVGYGEKKGKCQELCTEDDHIIPIGQGGSDELSNHQGLCAECHEEKTKTER